MRCTPGEARLASAILALSARSAPSPAASMRAPRDLDDWRPLMLNDATGLSIAGMIVGQMIYCDHAGLLLVTGTVGLVDGEVPPHGEPGLYVV
jgi:hypothetical protein